MTRPLFHIGEEIILQSIMHPEVNGIYTIEDIEEYPEIDLLGYFVYHYYLLGGPEGKWSEKALRKKPKPSGDSFSHMISKIKDMKVNNPEKV